MIAEDQPRSDNRVAIDPRRFDVHGLPRASVTHRYTTRDLRARRALSRLGRSILREAGAITTVALPIRTFSHAIGTMRMGAAAADSPVDPDGRFRGIDNLWVADGSVLPTAAGVNPSLTIAANALRIGRRIADTAGRPARCAHAGAESFTTSLARIDSPTEGRSGLSAVPRCT